MRGIAHLAPPHERRTSNNAECRVDRSLLRGSGSLDLQLPPATLPSQKLQRLGNEGHRASPPRSRPGPGRAACNCTSSQGNVVSLEAAFAFWGMVRVRGNADGTLE